MKSKYYTQPKAVRLVRPWSYRFFDDGRNILCAAKFQLAFRLFQGRIQDFAKGGALCKDDVTFGKICVMSVNNTFPTQCPQLMGSWEIMISSWEIMISSWEITISTDLSLNSYIDVSYISLVPTFHCYTSAIYICRLLRNIQSPTRYFGIMRKRHLKLQMLHIS